MISHIYYYSRSFETITISQRLVNQYQHQLTIVPCPTNYRSLTLARHVYDYWDELKHMTYETFPWNYYVNKYYGVGRQYQKIHAWEHWTKKGNLEHKNPINRLTVNTDDDVTELIFFIMTLLDAKKNHFDRILLVNDDQNAITPVDFTQIMTDYNDIFELNSICLFVFNKINYAYIINDSVYDVLLCEASYFLNNLDDLFALCIQTYNFPYQTLQHHTDQCDDLIMISEKQFSFSHLEFDPEQLNREIHDFRHKYFNAQFLTYIEDFNLSANDLDLINYIEHHLPFDRLKIKYNAYINLNFRNFLFLCTHVSTYDFSQTVQIQSLTQLVPNLNTVYFDYEMYLSVYPSYSRSLKNYADAFAHFRSHGIRENLIGNRVLFKLTRWRQQYLTQQMIRTFENNIPRPTSLILYQTDYESYQSDSPLIYVITRTCERPQLFRECYQSVRNQRYCRLRHIVSYDTESTNEYVKTYQKIFLTINLIEKRGHIHPNQYMDWIYGVLNQFEPGWILVLDDDDHLLTDYALYKVSQYSNDPNNCLIWMLYRPDKFIYPEDKENPILGEIGSCSYMYHSSKVKQGYWLGNSTGDFNFFKYIFNHTQNHIYFDFPLTGINYTKKISGWTAM